VIKSLLDEGRQDKKGFYFLTAKLVNASPVVASDDDPMRFSRSRAHHLVSRRAARAVEWGDSSPAARVRHRRHRRQPAWDAIDGRSQAVHTGSDAGSADAGKNRGSDSQFYVDVVVVKGDTPSQFLATTQPAAPVGKAPAKRRQPRGAISTEPPHASAGPATTCVVGSDRQSGRRGDTHRAGVMQWNF